MKYTFPKIFIKISLKLRPWSLWTTDRQTTDILLPYTETEQQPLHETTALHAYACTLMPHTRALLLTKGAPPSGGGKGGGEGGGLKISVTTGLRP